MTCNVSFYKFNRSKEGKPVKALFYQEKLHLGREATLGWTTFFAEVCKNATHWLATIWLQEKIREIALLCYEHTAYFSKFLFQPSLFSETTIGGFTIRFYIPKLSGCFIQARGQFRDYLQIIWYRTRVHKLKKSQGFFETIFSRKQKLFALKRHEICSLRL